MWRAQLLCLAHERQRGRGGGLPFGAAPRAGTGFGDLQNWGPHLQSSQRGQGISAMTGIRAAGGGLSEALAGHVPGVWEVASEGERAAWLGLVKWLLEPLGSLPITCSPPPHQRRAP